jgi:hypothetical protein
MVEYITNTTSETLTYHECENIPFVENIESTLMDGNYIKLSTKEYIFADFSQVSSSEPVSKPQYFGFRNNNAIINLEFGYDEE